MSVSWRWFVYYTITLIVVNEAKAAVTQKACPPQENILPCRCLTRGVEIQVWCSHSNVPKVLEGLRKVGQQVQEPIDELILENNQLASLPGKTFATLQVMRLMLRYNGLERVSSGWLTGLESTLMELFIVEPDLRSLPEDSLARLNTLEAVTIHSNLLKRPPKFANLPNLRHLQIESTSLTDLSSRNFRALPLLERLHIVGSPHLTRIEGGVLQDLPSLALVNISHCGISWIHPRAITHLPALTELSLVSNQIIDAAIIGRSIRDLPALEILHLDYNFLDKLGEAAFVDLPSLKKLYASNNQITELHHGAFHRVPKLEMLDLNKNLVKRVHPESFLQHSGSGLEELWLVENDIGHVAELRALLDALPRLIFLDMSYNRLEVIPFDALRGHPTLERLHLDHNKIHTIDREAFVAMPALRELRLQNNSLSDILGGPLWNLPALKGLDLSRNYFKALHPRLLANLPSLRRIDLSNNELTTVDPLSFSQTPSLEHVNISFNLLTNLHPSTFRPLVGLFELDVSSNRLVEFVPGLPHGIEHLHMSRNLMHNLPKQSSPDLNLPALKMLDVAYNGIGRISSGTLSSLRTLRKLYAGKNSLEQLEDGSLAGLSRLEVLDLQDNKIARVHDGAFRHVTELREINLAENRISALPPEVFQKITHMKKLDLSRNQLTQISTADLENAKDLQFIDASYNFLLTLPDNIFGMKHLRVLNLTHNRMQYINPSTLTSLSSLTELRMSQNLVQEMKTGAFDSLPMLKSLHLDSNELEIIEGHSFNSLPSLKMLKLSKNRLRNLPDFAFHNLHALQIIELQENRLMNISKNAFSDLPHLLMLNLSYNHFTTLEEAGLDNLGSLEMLDISNNRISRVHNGNFDKMEWLVELRLDNNDICTVQGTPFNEMPRLRVLSMKNNKMMSFPETTVQKLRGNLAVLDINGNPLACSCHILWFRAWLQESSIIGPKCNDGTLLREMRLSRQDCSREERQPEPVAPGCEADFLSNSGGYGTSQVLSLNTENNQLAPSPEESDYFYDEYVDYPYNETSPLANNNNNRNETQSSHYISGDTPTIYAASSKNKSKITPLLPNTDKIVSTSPSTSGFTFFGVPIPGLNLNLKNFWSRGDGRKAEVVQLQPNQVADRKTAIMNSVPFSRVPPTIPEIEKGGFVPLLPGSGGFKPIPNPIIRDRNEHGITNRVIPATTSTVKAAIAVEEAPRSSSSVVDVISTATSTSSTTTTSTTPSSTTRADTFEIEQVIIKEIEDIPKSEERKRQISNATLEKLVEDKNAADSEFITFTPTFIPRRFEDIFKEFVDNVSLPSTATTTSEQPKVAVSTTENSPTPLSAFLIPGAQQPQFRTQGRSTITRVQSPHVSGSAPLLSDLELTDDKQLPLITNREPKTSRLDGVLSPKLISKNQDMGWYFTNYNKTNLEPYIGPGGSSNQNSNSPKRAESKFAVIVYFCMLVLSTY